jgi:integrase
VHHALRHFRSAWLILIGTDIAVVSKTLGHKSIAITSDTYGSLQEKAAKDLAEKARGYVSRSRTALAARVPDICLTFGPETRSTT